MGPPLRRPRQHRRAARRERDRRRRRHRGQMALAALVVTAMAAAVFMVGGATGVSRPGAAPAVGAPRAATSTTAPPSTTPASSGPQTASRTGPGYSTHYGANGEADVNVCSNLVAPGTAQCDAQLRTDAAAGVTPAARDSRASPTLLGNNGAYDPSYLRSAYNAPSATNGAGQTVAIVDAFDDPSVASNLASYRSYFGLPACTTANNCFKKVNQSGGSIYPAGNQGWAEEISLDVDMVSALCPLCHILLVEANDNSFASLGAAVNEAVALGANVVSNSYGGGEYSGETQASTSYFSHPGVAITVAAGDNGYGVEFPAASPSVISVGGTSLHQSTNTGTRNATETVWSGTGSGCSAYEPKPAWQTDSGCSKRTVGDVSAVADPSTGVWVYDTYGDPGFEIFGGTSVATPIVGSFYALAANPASSAQLGSYPYGHSGALNDVVTGSDGSCGGSYLCTAGVGYDGPTGLGTPNGTPAFTPPAPGFSVSASPPTLTINPTAKATSTVTVSPQSGFTGTVNLACRGHRRRQQRLDDPAQWLGAGRPPGRNRDVDPDGEHGRPVHGHRDGHRRERLAHGDGDGQRRVPGFLVECDAHDQNDHSRSTGDLHRAGHAGWRLHGQRDLVVERTELV